MTIDRCIHIIFIDSVLSLPWTHHVWDMHEHHRMRPGGKKREKLAILFEEWTKCSERWESSSFVLRMREKTTEKQKGGRRWMTKADIIAKYRPGRTEEEATQIAEEIVMNKEATPDAQKPHPDAPLNPTMRLYLVWDESYESTEVDTVVESLFRQKEAGDGKKTPRPKVPRNANHRQKAQMKVRTVALMMKAQVPARTRRTVAKERRIRRPDRKARRQRRTSRRKRQRQRQRQKRRSPQTAAVTAKSRMSQKLDRVHRMMKNRRKKQRKRLRSKGNSKKRRQKRTERKLKQKQWKNRNARKQKPKKL